MKLQNKKTGEIGKLYSVCEDDEVWLKVEIEHDKEFYNTHTIQEVENFDIEYNSLTELTEEWKDYEEPKVNYYISADANIRKSFEFDYDRNSIGNSFMTPEEAEKAVEKLKAWKRLKDKGFERVFNLELGDALCGGKTAEFKLLVDDKNSIKDIKLIFGAEE